MKTKIRALANTYSNRKAEAIRRWKNGEKVSVIARELESSRDTIYRWIARSEKDFDAKRPRRKISIEHESRYKIIELFVLLGRPSMRKLRSHLALLHHVYLSESQLARYLKQIEFFKYRPSPLYRSLIHEAHLRINTPSQSRRDKVFDVVREIESLHKLPERS